MICALLYQFAFKDSTQREPGEGDKVVWIKVGELILITLNQVYQLPYGVWATRSGKLRARKKSTSGLEELLKISDGCPTRATCPPE
ncbi:MAG: hypothetical protein A4E65_03194 [Syntrophorhabdus sp. PtaU1.Bin153]|nr:MAG: hypothetical protein A4E65_03194 [Syntrophorhabdus sp. PtaU1.Bin153]